MVELLRARGPLTQAEIARATGLSPATVSNIVRELRDRGVVGPDLGASAGRRTVALRRTAGIVVGVDFGHRHLRLAVADLAHTVLAECARELPTDHRAEDGIPTAAGIVADLLDRVGVSRDTVVGVGLGLPGPIDRASGTVSSASILPGWVGVPVSERMGAALGLPVRVDNDANLGVLAELTWGAGAGCVDLAYVKVATGVGAGLVLGGRVYRGTLGTAGEIGHTTIDENGPLCRCGNRGCLEVYAGSAALLDLLTHWQDPPRTQSHLVDLALGGDPACQRVIADAGRVVGIAVANLVNLLCPERVVVGGDLARSGDVLLEPLRESVRRFAISAASRETRIVPGVLGERAQVLGAVALVLRDSARFTLPAEPPTAQPPPPPPPQAATPQPATPHPGPPDPSPHPHQEAR